MTVNVSVIGTKSIEVDVIVVLVHEVPLRKIEIVEDDDPKIPEAPEEDSKIDEAASNAWARSLWNFEVAKSEYGNPLAT